MNKLDLKLLLEIFTLKMRFEYCEDVCSCFYNKVYDYMFKSSVEFSTVKECLLHLIAFAHNNFERRLLKKFYDFVISHC